MNLSRFVKIIIYALLLFVPLSLPVSAEQKTNVYIFYGQGCPHCATERVFLNSLKNRDHSFNLIELEVWYNRDNQRILLDVGRKLGVEISGVPFLVIGDRYVVGYLSDETTGRQIEKMLLNCADNRCPDIVATANSEIPTSNGNSDNPPEKTSDSPVPGNESEGANVVVNGKSGGDENKAQDGPELPTLLGVDLSDLSLPALTVVLGFLDGFNPCAMWVLLFLIALLFDMEDKRKMWLLGVVFIVSSAFVYFMFMVAWLKIFQFIGAVPWIRGIIAAVALTGGVMSLRKASSKNTSGCDIAGEATRKNIFAKLGNITSNKSFVLALVGIVFLAFSVNLLELVCSFGLPAVYSQVLALNKLPIYEYYLYILIYIFFFMLDDLFVFIVSMATLQLTGITTKYMKYTRLAVGILMLFIGIVLLAKPELLMFT